MIPRWKKIGLSLLFFVLRSIGTFLEKKLLTCNVEKLDVKDVRIQRHIRHWEKLLCRAGTGLKYLGFEPQSGFQFGAQVRLGPLDYLFWVCLRSR